MSKKFSLPSHEFETDSGRKEWSVANYGNDATGTTSGLFVTKVASGEGIRFALLHVIEGAEHPTTMHGPADLGSCCSQIERCHHQILAEGWVPLTEHIMH